MSAFDEAISELEEVAVLYGTMSYDWDELRVWSDGKQLYWAHDSGCSCGYFGWNLGYDDLKVLDSVDSPAFRDAISSCMDMEDTTEQEKQEFLSAVRSAMMSVKR